MPSFGHTPLPADTSITPLATFKAWHAAGSHRIDRDRDGTYESSDAIRIMDAWWPKWVNGQFEPTLGKPLWDRFVGLMGGIDNDPNNGGAHLGSAQLAEYGQGGDARQLPATGELTQAAPGDAT